MTSTEKNVKSILVQLMIKDNLSLTVEINGGKKYDSLMSLAFFHEQRIVAARETIRYEYSLLRALSMECYDKK